MTKIEPQPPPTMLVGCNEWHSWCLTDQSKFDLPKTEKDWLTVNKPSPEAEPKLVKGVWYWI